MLKLTQRTAGCSRTCQPDGAHHGNSPGAARPSYAAPGATQGVGTGVRRGVGLPSPGLGGTLLPRVTRVSGVEGGGPFYL